MTTPTVSLTSHDVVAFWLASTDHWFVKSDAFDTRFKEQFEALHWQAARRELDHWAEHDEGAFALLILLDQFPRNSYRHTGHMYATDSLARYYARLLAERKGDLNIDINARFFCYLPFTHSENLDDQDLAVRLHERGKTQGEKEFALHHREIIKKFGRFPHRNAILARASTPEELQFLEDGGFQG